MSELIILYIGLNNQITISIIRKNSDIFIQVLYNKDMKRNFHQSLNHF
jgi:hypothetical protein